MAYSSGGHLPYARDPEVSPLRSVLVAVYSAHWPGMQTEWKMGPRCIHGTSHLSTWPGTKYLPLFVGWARSCKAPGAAILSTHHPTSPGRAQKQRRKNLSLE